MRHINAIRFLRLFVSTYFWVGGICIGLISLLAINLPDYVVPFVFAWAVLAAPLWVWLDARVRNERIGAGMLVGVTLFGFIFVPAYILKTRPPNKNLLSFAKFFGLLVFCYVLTAFIFEWIKYGKILSLTTGS